MKLTVDIDDRLAADIEALAAADGQPVAAVMETALRAALARRRIHPRFTTDGAGGLRPGVDLEDSAGLRDIMDSLC